MSFDKLRELYDLQSLSHRGLNRVLVPAWLEQKSLDLDGEIESSAYGETCPRIAALIFERLELSHRDVFLDLGAGAGNIVLQASPFCAQAIGFERNPHLAELGRALFEQLSNQNCDLREVDFLTETWPKATKVYAASARFSKNTLRILGARLTAHADIEAFACLGRTPSLSSDWELKLQERHDVRWNKDEARLPEILSVWSRAAR